MFAFVLIVTLFAPEGHATAQFRAAFETSRDCELAREVIADISSAAGLEMSAGCVREAA